MPSNTHEIRNVCVFAGSSPGNRKIYSETASELAEKLTENNYGIVTNKLKELGVKYHKSNAGIFVWVDLREYLPE